MKKLISALMLGVVLVVSSGCGTTLVTRTVQVEGVIIYSVDTYMKAWADWVKAGKASQQQVDVVKAAYVTYYDSQMIAKAALEKWIVSKSTNDAAAIETANNAVQVAKDSLIAIITRYLNKL